MGGCPGRLIHPLRYKTNMVRTVRGSVSPAELGRTLMHEHLVFGPPGWATDRTVAEHDDDDRFVERAVERVAAARDGYGVGTIVEATPNDAGRRPAVLRAVAEETGVNVVCSTGLYPEARGAATYFKHRDLLSDGVAELVELFTAEITDGIHGSDVRAGVVKVGTSHDQVTEYEEMVLTAAARTQRETGVPVITHTTAGTMAPEQAEHLVANGAAPGKVVVGHAGPHDLADLRAVVETEASVGFDQFGMESEAPDDERVEKLLALVREGYGDRVVVSNDYIVNWLSRSVDPIGERLPNWTLERVFEQVLPLGERAGVDPDRLLVDNPRDLFADDGRPT